MITKIGKKLLMLSVASAGLLSGSMTLEITNTLGIPLTSINVGAPFFVIISLKGTVPDRWPVIDSLDKVHIVGQRTEAKTREGSPADRDEKKLIYTVIADKPGALSLGPAHSGMQRSNAKTISVVEGHYPSASSTLKPSYTISIPSKHYVVGERIPFTLTFSTRREESKLAHLETLHGEGIKGEILTTGEAKVIASNGELTSVIEYKGYFYAAKTGELILRPLRADYTIPLSRQSSLSTDFFFGLRPSIQTTAVYTPQKSLTIDPLPPTNLPISAVGKLTRYTATLNAHQAPRGEALTLTLALEGEANFEDIQLPQLVLPEGIRVYQSKATLSQTPQGEKKEWEYILQGLKEGVYTLEKQHLFYFDTTTRLYKKISTESIPFTITPGAPLGTEQKKKPSPDLVPEVTKEPQKADDQIPNGSEIALPWMLFLLLFLIPPLCGIGKRIVRFIVPSLRKRLRLIQERWILYRTGRALHHARRTNDFSQLYDIMKRGMASYLQLSPDASQEELYQALHNRGISKQLLEEWTSLHTALISYSPYAPVKPVTQSLDLFKMAREWLHLLKRVPYVLLLCFAVQPLEARNGLDLGVVVHALSALSSYAPFVVWQLLVLSTWALCWYYGTIYKRRAFLVSFFLFLMAVAGWTLRAKIHYYPTGYVSSEGAPLYLGPDNSYAIRGKLKPGDTLTVAEKKDSWYYVASSEGNGWVKTEDVTLKA